MAFSYNFDDDILEHQRLVDADNELELKRLLRKYGSLEGIEKNADIRDSMAYMMANQNGLAQKVLTQKTGNSLLSSQGTQYAKNDRANHVSDASEVTGNLSAEHESGSRPQSISFPNIIILQKLLLMQEGMKERILVQNDLKRLGKAYLEMIFLINLRDSLY